MKHFFSCAAIFLALILAALCALAEQESAAGEGVEEIEGIKEITEIEEIEEIVEIEVPAEGVDAAEIVELVEEAVPGDEATGGEVLPDEAVSVEAVSDEAVPAAEEPLRVLTPSLEKMYFAPGETIRVRPNVSGGSGTYAYTYHIYTNAGVLVAALEDTTQPYADFTITQPGVYCAQVFGSDFSTAAASDVFWFAIEQGAPSADPLRVLTPSLEKMYYTPGETVHVRANVSGGSGAYTYSYYVYTNANVLVASTLNDTYPAANFWVAQPGVYYAQVAVSDGSSSGVSDPFWFAVEDPYALKIATPTLAQMYYSPGETVHVQANVSGGSGAYVYNFYVYSNTDRVVASHLGERTAAANFWIAEPGVYYAQVAASDGSSSGVSDPFWFVITEPPEAIYEYEVSNGAATITGYTGPESADLIIPSMIGRVPVTTIKSYAFNDRTELTGHLILPSTLVTIGSGAFADTGIQGDLRIPDSVTTINHDAFHGCSGLNGTLTVGANVRSIGYDAFSGCRFSAFSIAPGSYAESALSDYTGAHADAAKNFTYRVQNGGVSIVGYVGPAAYNLAIPSVIDGLPVTEIQSYAFYQRSDLTGTISIPSTVTHIGDFAFTYCDGLTGTLSLPASLRTIGEYAFLACSGINHLALNDGLQQIGERAFAHCTGLTGGLWLPGTLTSIGENAFFNCSGLSGTLTIPGSVASISDGAFFECSGFSGLTIGPGVTSIGNSAFYACSGLSGGLTIPEGVASVGSTAFAECSGFSGTLTLPASLTSIGDSAFFQCDFASGSAPAGSYAASWLAQNGF